MIRFHTVNRASRAQCRRAISYDRQPHKEEVKFRLHRPVNLSDDNYKAAGALRQQPPARPTEVLAP
jgi:hypothetical protein